MKILFVDAGNYCRSPAAEVVAREIAARHGHHRALTFGSAGLKDKHVGDGADRRSIEACRLRGYDLSAHRCREIEPRDFLEFDLVLAMDRENLAQLEQRRPRDARARLALFLTDAEVPDPYFGGPEGFDAMMDLIEAGARELIARHGGEPR